MKLHHINCQNPKCSICFNDAMNLERYICKQTGTGNKVDHLGKYHKWLSDKGINPETEFGWFTSAVFDDENIQNYIAWYMKTEQLLKEFD